MINLKQWFSMALVSGLAVLLVGILAVTPAFAQGPGWMMGGPGSGWMMGNTQGYTGTVPYGPGWTMGRPGCMMGNTWRAESWMHGDGWGDGWNHWGMMPGYGYISDVSALRATVPPTTTTAVSYKTDVQPVFDARCVICHGGTAGLVLSNYENIFRGGMHGLVVIPGDPVNSRLIQYVSSGYMPAGGPPLTQSQIQALVNWVAAGAPDN